VALLTRLAALLAAFSGLVGRLVSGPATSLRDKVAPSSRVNAMVSSFFIQSPSEKSVFGNRSIWGIIDVQHSKQRSWKKESGHFAGPLFGTISRKLFRRRGAVGSALLRFLAAFVVALMFLASFFARIGRRGAGLARGLSASGAAASLSKAQDAAQYQSARDCE
jgi:hypothetical protein